MISASAAFKTAADDPQRITQKKFVFNGTDHSTKTDDLGTISVRQYEGDDVTAGPLTVAVINDDKTFNAVFADKPANFGKAGTVSLGFDGEYVDIYKGYLEQPELVITDRHRALLTFTHKLKACIERTLGSEAYPLDYTAVAYNPADLVWDLLVTRGGLDATAGVGNPDIDYAAWLEVHDICDALSFSLKAYFTGQTIAEALRLIGWLTDAIIYPDPTGKVVCKKFIPRAASTPYLFTDASGHIEAPRFYANRARILNKMKAWYGYDPATQTWAGSVTKENATSQAAYGLLGRESDSTVVWHADSTSASAWAERLVARYIEPADTIEFDTNRGTQALLHQIGDIAQVTCAKFDLSAVNMQVYGLEHAAQPGRVKLIAEDLGALNRQFFILDSATNGVLDQNVLY